MKNRTLLFIVALLSLCVLSGCYYHGYYAGYYDDDYYGAYYDDYADYPWYPHYYADYSWGYPYFSPYYYSPYWYSPFGLSFSFPYGRHFRPHDRDHGRDGRDGRGREPFPERQIHPRADESGRGGGHSDFPERQIHPGSGRDLRR